MRGISGSGKSPSKIVFALVLISVLAGLLLWQALSIADFGPNLALNLGADLIGAIVVIFVVSPLITRAQHGRVREHRRLDYDWFTDQVVHATSEVRILDTFSGLLDRPGTARFLRVTRDSLLRRARVRILLVDPTAPQPAQHRARRPSAMCGPRCGTSGCSTGSSDLVERSAVGSSVAAQRLAAATMYR
jgi:hypothetical protein